MADISGPGGSVGGPNGFNAHIQGWSGTLNVTLVETTGFAEVGNRTYDATAINLTGSAVGTAQSGSTPIAAAGLGATPSMASFKAPITLTAASGDLYTFTAAISAIALNRPHDGKCDYAINFVSSGAITQTWS